MKWCKLTQKRHRLPLLSLPSLQSLLFICLSLFSSCASQPAYNSGTVSSVNKNEYESIINKYTRHDRQYSGLYQTYEVQGTLLNSKVNQILLQKKGFYHQWNGEKVRKEREKVMQSMSSETSLFFSFFTPKREHNDLNKGATIWRVYLEVNGVRYEGHVKKSKDKLVDIKHLFSYHNRWSTPYRVHFKAPMTAVEQTHSKVVFTSSIGTTIFEFPASKF